MIFWSDLFHPRLLQRPVMPMPALGYPPGPMDDEDRPSRGFVSSTKPGTHMSPLRRAPDGAGLTREVELLEGLAAAGASVRERARMLYWKLRMSSGGWSADMSDPNAPREEYGLLLARVAHLMGAP